MKIYFLTLLVLSFSLTRAQIQVPGNNDTTNFPSNIGQPTPPVNSINTDPPGAMQNTPGNNTNPGSYNNSGTTNYNDPGNMQNTGVNMNNNKSGTNNKNNSNSNKAGTKMSDKMSMWKSDSAFVKKAGEGGLLEVKLGKLAVNKGTSQKVIDLGQMLVDDHSKANEELKTIAKNKGIYIPAKLSQKAQSMYNQLAAKKGKEFDKAYVKMMIKDHEKDIAMFQEEAGKGKISEIKNWASDKIPTLQHHLDKAREAEKAIDNVP